MEEDQKIDSYLEVKIQFDRHPLLPTLVKNPTHYLQSPWTQSVSQQLHSLFGSRGDKAFYRIIYSPGTTGELMTIQKGPLAGLQTTSVVDGGRISSVAGLEKVDGQMARDLMPMLLTMGALNSIHARLGYITDICTDIRNRQISGDKAKLERISEVIVDCFESMTEADERLNEANLRRVTNNTDDCFEILSTLLEDLIAQHKAKQMDFESVDESAGVSWYSSRTLPNPTAAIRDLMRHSVFAAYERYAAGRACQVVLSGNYSQSNIGRHKRALERVRDSIRKVFDERMERHHRGVKFFQEKIDNLYRGFDESNWTMESAQRSLNCQNHVIKELESELYALLDARIADFDALAQIFRKGKFQIIVIDDAMIFSEEGAPLLANEEVLSSKDSLITNQIPQGLKLN
jgi:hypothetical protein